MKIKKYYGDFECDFECDFDAIPMYIIEDRRKKLKKLISRIKDEQRRSN